MSEDKKIYIPFIDGILNFDCQECGYACCCQSGYLVMNNKEKKLLLKQSPNLRYFFSKDTKSLYTIKKYPRCWFLGLKGSCRIQEEHGYSSKPFLCRLHPFYVARHKDVYIVIPSDICPLSIAKERTGASHKQILENVYEAIQYEYCSEEEMNWSTQRVDLEKQILKDSEDFLNKKSYIDFCAHQILLAENNKNSKRIKSGLNARIKLWKSFLHVESLDIENRRITFELTAVTSLLRAGSPLLRDMDVAEIPLVFLAVYFYMNLFLMNREDKTYLKTYKLLLADYSLGLVCLKDSDLDIKFRSLEDKINYLRGLNEMYMRIQAPNSKDKKEMSAR